jgi:hypothetical protein
MYIFPRYILVYCVWKNLAALVRGTEHILLRRRGKFAFPRIWQKNV